MTISTSSTLTLNADRKACSASVFTSGRPAIVVRDIDFAFDGGDRVPCYSLFSRFSCVIEARTITAIMGASGVGKSTLAALMAGCIRPQRGEVQHGGVQKSSDVAYVDQQPLNVVFPWQNVTTNLDYPLRRLHWVNADRRQRVDQLLEAFRLQHVADAFPARLSGGELQRLALARSMSFRPRIVVLDETFSALDPITRAGTLRTVKALVGEDGTTLVAITHSITDAMAIADRCIVLEGRPATIAVDIDIRTQNLSESGFRALVISAIRDGHL